MIIVLLSQIMEITTEIIVPNKNIIPDEVIAENIPNENLNYEQLQLVEKLKPSLKRLNHKQ